MLNAGTKDKDKRSYNEMTKENKKKNIILVKPKSQQNSEDIEKIIKEKVYINKINMGVSKFKKGINSTVILGCHEDKNFRIKETIMKKLGDKFKVTEAIPRKLKVKIINIRKELEMEDKELLDTIKKQNRIETNIDGFHMQLLKRVKRRDEERENCSSRISKEEESIILELDDNTHRLMTKERKMNV